MATASAQATYGVEVRVQLDVSRAKVLSDLANEEYSGQRSPAVRALIDLYEDEKAKRERLEAGLPSEISPAEVMRWKKKGPTRELVGLVAAFVAGGHGSRLDGFAEFGVTERQARKWLSQGEQDRNAGRESNLADLCWALDKADNVIRKKLLAEAHRKRDYPKLLKWLFPEQFGEKRAVTSTVKHEVQPMIVWEQLELAEARSLVALLRKASPSQDDPALGRGAAPAAAVLIPGELVDEIEAGRWEPLALEAGPKPQDKGAAQKPPS